MAVTQSALEPTQVKIVEPKTMLERFNKLSEQVSQRAYEIFERNGRMSGHDVDDWFQAESEILPPLELRINETADTVAIEAEAPGFNTKNLEVSLEPWRLTISGMKESKEEKTEGKTIHQEQPSEQFLQVIDLPSEIDSAKATASLKNGLLQIKLPKVAKAIPTRAGVKSA